MNKLCQGCEGFYKPWKCDDGEIEVCFVKIQETRLSEPEAFKEAMCWQEVNETTKQICNGITSLMNFIFDKPKGLNIVR